MLKVATWSEMPLERVTADISRKIITGVNEMIAHVYLKKGGLVPVHSHVSEQITYVLQGALKFRIEGEEYVVSTGQVLVIPPNVPHEAVALEDTLDVDIFSPIRQDWLDGTDTYFQKAVPRG
jgi:quercetin dioxygenase-like cupin family protein